MKSDDTPGHMSYCRRTCAIGTGLRPPCRSRSAAATYMPDRMTWAERTAKAITTHPRHLLRFRCSVLNTDMPTNITAASNVISPV